MEHDITVTMSYNLTLQWGIHVPMRDDVLPTCPQHRLVIRLGVNVDIYYR